MSTGGLKVSAKLVRRDFLIEIELELEPGERVALVGPSGAGKTSILKVIAGLVPPETGRIRIGGQTVFDSQERIDVPPEARGCGYVPQDYSLFPHLTASQNVGFGMKGVNAAERRQRSAELLEQLGMGALGDVRPSEMSGGERQRVALARALATEPEVFLLDEPLAALDADARDQAIPVLGDVLARTGVPVLIVTHSHEEALSLAGSTMMIERGRVSRARNHPRSEQHGGNQPSAVEHRVARNRGD